MHLARIAYVVALAFAGTGNAAEPLRASIERCESRIDVQVDVGYERIAARCPELVRQLESGEWQDWLPRNWREPGNDLSFGGLRELARLIEREQLRERTGPRPGTAKLHEVLNRLEAAQPAAGGILARFRNWADSVFGHAADDGSSAWLERLLARATASQVVIEALTYLAIAAILVLTAGIVVSELRAATALRRRRREPDQSSLELKRASEPSFEPFRFEQASLQDRPALLLRLVLERLAQAGRLPRPASLTVREAQALAAIPDPGDRERLAELAAAAEQVRYARRPAAAGVLGRAIEAGAQLLAHLETARARVP